MLNPLVQLGPGGEYTARYIAQGQQLHKRVNQTQQQHDNPDTEGGAYMSGYSHQGGGNHGNSGDTSDSSGASHSGPERRDRFEHDTTPAEEILARAACDRLVKKAEQCAAAAAITAWWGLQTQALRQSCEAVVALSDATPDALDLAAMNRLGGTGLVSMKRFELNLQESNDGAQTHPQTTETPAAHPRLAADQRLFPDLAGIGRRSGRQQSHRLRARRSAHQERRVATRSEQGSLFGALA